ncbi:MAG: glycosyl hydrolase family 18 protein [Ignavibacteria bacterium]
MKYFFRLVVLLSILTSSLAEAKLTVGYYMSNYSQYPASAIKYDNLTHICHAFIWPNADGSIHTDSWFLYPALITTAHNNGVKVLVSVGGWGVDQTAGFSGMVNSTSARTLFITNLVSFCLKNGYDGADLDWEYPTQTDSANFVAFVSALRQAFNNAGISLITATLPATDWNNGFNITQLNDYLDWYGVMTYDFAGSWESDAMHNSPLYSTAGQLGSVDASVRYYLLRGIPKNKLLIGIAFYGYNQKTAGLYSALQDKEAVTIIYNDATTCRNSAGWNYIFDQNAKVPYLQDTEKTHIITYDDTMSVRLKCEYVKSQELGGAILWELHQSYNGKENILLETAGKNLTKMNTSVKRYMIPQKFEVNCYPNPFNVTAKIKYSIPGTEGVALFNVRVTISDLLGRQVRELVNSVKPAGIYEVNFDGSALSGGVYLCFVEAGNSKCAIKIALVK